MAVAPSRLLRAECLAQLAQAMMIARYLGPLAVAHVSGSWLVEQLDHLAQEPAQRNYRTPEQ